MSTNSDLWNLQSELYSIIRELRSIASAMQNETQGISMNRYAAKVNEIANEYQRHYNTLRNARIVDKK